MNPNVCIIAGPNGAGKTTFAREFLPNYADCNNFIKEIESSTVPRNRIFVLPDGSGHQREPDQLHAELQRIFNPSRNFPLGTSQMRTYTPEAVPSERNFSSSHTLPSRDTSRSVLSGSPGVPIKPEEIISKALEKDRSSFPLAQGLKSESQAVETRQVWAHVGLTGIWMALSLDQ